jgi:hypothetical protein
VGYTGSEPEKAIVNITAAGTSRRRARVGPAYRIEIPSLDQGIDHRLNCLAADRTKMLGMKRCWARNVAGVGPTQPIENKPIGPSKRPTQLVRSPNWGKKSGLRKSFPSDYEK